MGVRWFQRLESGVVRESSLVQYRQNMSSNEKEELAGWACCGARWAGGFTGEAVMNSPNEFVVNSTEAMVVNHRRDCLMNSPTIYRRKHR